MGGRVTACRIPSDAMDEKDSFSGQKLSTINQKFLLLRLVRPS